MKKSLLAVVSLVAISSQAQINLAPDSVMTEKTKLAVESFLAKKCYGLSQVTELTTTQVVDRVDQGLVDVFNTTTLTALLKIDQGQYDEVKLVLKTTETFANNNPEVSVEVVSSEPQQVCFQ